MPLKFENTGIRKVIFNDGVKNTELRKIIYNDVTVWVSYIEPIIDVVGGRAEILVTIKNLNQYDDMLVALSTTKETLMDLVVAKNSSKQFKIKANHGTNSTVRISVHVPDLGGGEYVKYASVKPPYVYGMLDIQSLSVRNYQLYVDYTYRGYEPFNDYNFSIDYYIDSGFWNGGTDDMNNWEPDAYGYEGSVTITKESGDFAIPMDDRWYGDMLLFFTIKESGEEVDSGRLTAYLPSKPTKLNSSINNGIDTVLLTLRNPNKLYSVSGNIGYGSSSNIISNIVLNPLEQKDYNLTSNIDYGINNLYLEYTISSESFSDTIQCIKFPDWDVVRADSESPMRFTAYSLQPNAIQDYTRLGMNLKYYNDYSTSETTSGLVQLFQSSISASVTPNANYTKPVRYELLNGDNVLKSKRMIEKPKIRLSGGAGEFVINIDNTLNNEYGANCSFTALSFSGEKRIFVPAGNSRSLTVTNVNPGEHNVKAFFSLGKYASYTEYKTVTVAYKPPQGYVSPEIVVDVLSQDDGTITIRNNGSVTYFIEVQGERGITDSHTGTDMDFYLKSTTLAPNTTAPYKWFYRGIESGKTVFNFYVRVYENSSKKQEIESFNVEATSSSTTITPRNWKITKENNFTFYSNKEIGEKNE